MTKLHNELLRDIGTLARTIYYLPDLHFKELALQRGQFIFLTRICENAGINQNDLSLLLKVDKSTTAKAVQKLTAAGYISRQRSSTDQRQWQLVPTAKAWAGVQADYRRRKCQSGHLPAKFYTGRAKDCCQAGTKNVRQCADTLAGKQNVRWEDVKSSNNAGSAAYYGDRTGYDGRNARLR